MISARCWSARPLSKDPRHPIAGNVCATIWPTRALNSRERWFDEIYVWTEGFQASTTQRARIQLVTLENALGLLEREQVHQVGITLSFGTIERFLDPLVERFQSHPLVLHRVVVMVRGALSRLRSRYQLRAFIGHLRGQRIPVGYYVATPRVSTELKALEFLRPDFAKLAAPNSLRIELWEDFVLEARVAGVAREWMIVSGLENADQVSLATQVGIRFGQGSAVRPAYVPVLEDPSATTVFGRADMMSSDDMLV